MENFINKKWRKHLFIPSWEKTELYHERFGWAYGSDATDEENYDRRGEQRETINIALTKDKFFFLGKMGYHCVMICSELKPVV